MRLTADQKTDMLFHEMLRLSDESFVGLERPPSNFFRAHFDADDVFVIVEDGYLRGFAIVTERSGPYIWSIAVDYRWQRAGVATRLLQEIKDHYRPLREHIQLTCKIDNWVAQVAYLKSGYRIVRVVPRYYGGEDGVLMRREF